MVYNSIYTLTESYENDSGLREFYVITTSYDKEKLKVIMDGLIKEDEYGLIAKNGIQRQTDNSFETVFEDGFVGYDITNVKCV